MWMRSCAVCKALLRKLQLSDSVRCECGWEWQSNETFADTKPVKDVRAGIGSDLWPS